MDVNQEYFVCVKCDRKEHVEDIFAQGKISVENADYGAYVNLYKDEKTFVWVCDDCCYCGTCGSFCLNIDDVYMQCECPLTCREGVSDYQLKKVKELVDDMLTFAQGIRTREVQAISESPSWDEYKKQSDSEWKKLNSTHRNLTYLLTGERS